MNDNVDGSKPNIVSCWLEDFKSLAGDIGSRVKLQHGLLNFQILVTVGLAGFLVALIKDGNKCIYDDEVKFIILLFPLVFCFFAWRHLNHDVNIIDKATYIYNVIRPNLVNLCGDNKLFGFEMFLEKCRKERTKKFGFLIWLGGEHFIHILFSMILLLLGYATFMLSPGKFVIASNINEFIWFISQDVLLFLSTFAVYGTINLRIKVSKAYISIVSGENAI